MWVIKHKSDSSKYSGYYLADKGNDHSYTKDIEKIKIFYTKEQANADLCVDSEFIVSLIDCLSA